MPTPTRPESRYEDDGPLFREVVHAVGYDPGHQGEEAADATGTEPDNPASPPR